MFEEAEESTTRPTEQESATGTLVGGADVADGAADTVEAPTTDTAAPSNTEEPEDKEKGEAENKEDTEGQEEAPALDIETLKEILPDGFELQEEVAQDFIEALSGDLDPKARAEKLLDLHAQTVQGTVEQMNKEWNKTISEWAEETKKTYGEDLQKVLPRAKRVAQEFGGDEFLKILDTTGLGNNKVVVETLWKIAQQIYEQPGEAAGAAQQQKSVSALDIFGIN